MPSTAKYIVEKCTNEQLKLHVFTSRETDRLANVGIKLITGEESAPTLTTEEILEESCKIPSSSLQKNLEKIMFRGGWKPKTSAMRYLQSWNDSNWLIIN